MQVKIYIAAAAGKPLQDPAHYILDIMMYATNEGAFVSTEEDFKANFIGYFDTSWIKKHSLV